MSLLYQRRRFRARRRRSFILLSAYATRQRHRHIYGIHAARFLSFTMAAYYVMPRRVIRYRHYFTLTAC